MLAPHTNQLRGHLAIPKSWSKKTSLPIKIKTRKTAILTDTPVKEALAAERQAQGKNNPFQKKCTGTKSKTPGENKAGIKRKTLQASSSDEDECLCLVCVEPFANSRPREAWVQCA